ncbi:lipid-binding protein [Dokdonia pacifica]|uniref:Polyisoprenoid-binding protein YceI n=1 Tax=Dokdonia pacifica TaxID=1627892 RepID=A0A238ZJ01_9FLAO|nr:YceI family protein [Dokdonia pacifica]GGG06729.1 lipid-binding protein [Dokdonia pacifica]SNR83132.1 Polyisoprenoid-binding protein YceI [Dokdonia pacifica]
MNKYRAIFIVFLCFASCTSKNHSVVQKAIITEAKVSDIKTKGDTIPISIETSSILWEGTKLRGSKKHEGKVDLQKGYFITHQNKITGGHFTVDMSTIAVTDIPEYEPIPRRNLNEHLKGSDFFDVDRFPKATFEMIQASYKTEKIAEITGDLTIKGKTHTIVFEAIFTNTHFSTTFTIDRFQWGIAYEENFIQKTVIDKDIKLTIRCGFK